MEPANFTFVFDPGDDFQTRANLESVALQSDEASKQLLSGCITTFTYDWAREPPWGNQPDKPN